MTSANLFGSPSSAELHHQLCELSDRKLHLLTAAILRRVWGDLPSDHTRIAVEVTEKFADGRVTLEELARLRSVDLLETCEPLWTESGYLDEDLIGAGCPCCEWEPRTREYECRVAHNGYVLDGVRAGVKRPEWITVKAANYAREIVAWKAPSAKRDELAREEAWAQYRLFREVGGYSSPDPRWPQWRTTTVVALARGIHRDQAYDRMPILADALQDADCDDDEVLSHCREPREHVRGCWVVDLAMGVG